MEKIYVNLTKHSKGVFVSKLLTYFVETCKFKLSTVAVFARCRLTNYNKLINAECLRPGKDNFVCHYLVANCLDIEK